MRRLLRLLLSRWWLWSLGSLKLHIPIFLESILKSQFLSFFTCRLLNLGEEELLVHDLVVKDTVHAFEEPRGGVDVVSVE